MNQLVGFSGVAVGFVAAYLMLAVVCTIIDIIKKRRK